MWNWAKVCEDMFEDGLIVEDLEFALNNTARNSKKHKSFDLDIYYDNTVSATCPFRILTTITKYDWFK